VAHYKARGLNIDYVQRPTRTGYKAGALAYGLTRTQADFICIFDADFRPPADFLQRVIPQFADQTLGLVQTRWGHLNAEHSLLTRAQALMLDGHFGIEQYVRSRMGWLLNFNGSAGVWRRACIDEAGGWQADTLAEDLDLSYRAQLLGWRLHYLPDVVAPAEIPTLVGAFKRQQFRWAKGSIQCLLKNGGRLVNSSESLIRKIEGLLHLSGYLVHPLMMLVVLLSLPLVITGDINQAHLGAIGLAGFGAPILFTMSQFTLYPKDWYKRLLFLPTILFLGPGIALSNTAAIAEAVLGRNPTLFLRTPKFHAANQSQTPQETGFYNLPIDWTTWAEIFFMIYTGLITAFALQRAPGLAPFTASYAIGFGYTAWLGLKQSPIFNPKPATQVATMD
jgi:cellulose synthase/poly-beta-1,6-N-acetylglucosamine synthase-like glycosyltransferase